MYNSYILALTCVMSDLDSFTVHSSHVHRVVVGICTRLVFLFATAALRGTQEHLHVVSVSTYIKGSFEPRISTKTHK